jgi:hypothetical protein
MQNRFSPKGSLGKGWARPIKQNKLAEQLLRKQLYKMWKLIK